MPRILYEIIWNRRTGVYLRVDESEGEEPADVYPMCLPWIPLQDVPIHKLLRTGVHLGWCGEEAPLYHVLNCPAKEITRWRHSFEPWRTCDYDVERLSVEDLDVDADSLRHHAAPEQSSLAEPYTTYGIVHIKLAYKGSA